MSYLKRTAYIATPCIIENIVVSLASIVDTVMVGKLGATATAAVALNMPMSWVIAAMSLGFSVGGTALVARYIGAADPESANTVASNALSLSIVFSLLVTVFFLGICNYIPILMGAEPDVLPYAQDYLRTYMYSIPFLFCALLCSGLLRGAGNTKLPMYLSLSFSALKITGNFLFIYPTSTFLLFGHKISVFGFGLGVHGAALSTTISYVFFGTAATFILIRGRQDIKIVPSSLLKPDFAVIRKILSIGLPAACERMIISVGQMIYLRIVSSLGTVQVAAHYLAIMAESISYMPANGFSAAATTLVGQSLGAKNEKDARGYANTNLYLTLILSCICGLIFFFFPHELLGLFSSDPAVIEAGAGAMRTIAIFEPVFNGCIVIIGILRGAGDTKVPLYAAFFGMWGIRLTFAWLLVYPCGLGLMGAWIAMGIDNTFRIIILLSRYRGNKWMHHALK